MVTYNFSTKLSKDYVSFYENGKECADVIIRAGREGSVEEFYAHSFVLLIRSNYFRKELEGVKEKNADNKIIIEKPDINPKLFDKILRYFYGGKLEFDEKNSKEMFEFFLITKELNVSELLDVLQNQFLKSPRQIYQNFSTTLQISSSHESFKKLHEFCLKTIESSPEIIFKSEDFHLLDENTLLVLLQNEKLKVEEIEKWEFIIKWGISRTFADTGSSASPPPAAENFKETADVSLWTRDKFRDLSNTLKQFIPLIDFYKIKPEDFYEKVKPFKKIIEKPLFEDILKYHIVSSKNLDSTTSKSTSQPTSSPTSTASSPQKDRPEPIFNIRLNSILDLDHFRLFTKWINETTNISSNSDICYNFSLILRGSENGLTAGKFHELCDNKGPTLSIIKIRGSTEIIGGYNPISWDQSLYPDSTYFRTNECFVFKLNKQANKSIIGRPRPGSSGMVGNIPNHGPTFNGALYLKGDFGREYGSICKGNAYTVHIRDIQAPFLVEELEVYQVIKEVHGSNP